ncbi:MAG: ribonuclease P protein component, partial [Desulfobulbia bacterium]
MQNTFGKEEKLKSKKVIERLFEEGKRIKSFPLQLVFLKIDHQGESPFKVGFSVPKRQIKLAVDRNRIKRVIKEAYRNNKAAFIDSDTEKYALMFVYTTSK